jgi:Zn-dependent protease
MTSKVEAGAPARPAPRTTAAWPLERILFAMAGTVTLVAALLAATVSPWWLLLAAFVGVNQLAFVVFGDCVASLVLRRAFGVESGCLR